MIWDRKQKQLSFCKQPVEWLIYATVAIGNPERHVRKASHRGSKQQ